MDDGDHSSLVHRTQAASLTYLFNKSHWIPAPHQGLDGTPELLEIYHILPVY